MRASTSLRDSIRSIADGRDFENSIMDYETGDDRLLRLLSAMVEGVEQARPRPAR